MVCTRRTVLVVDDGGLPFERLDSTGYPIPFDSYKRILQLAQESDTTIPIAVTACFFDMENLSGKASLNKDAEKIIYFLQEHSDYLPVWNHGLTHSYKNVPTEFLLLRSQERVPEPIQREHLELSQTIFERVGLTKPEVLVPPGHAWEPGVTDKVAHEVGLKFIAITEFEKKLLKEWIVNPKSPYIRVWEKSQYLKTLYRRGIGFPYNKNRFTALDLIKTKQYICPANRLMHYLVYRRVTPVVKPHHFFAHLHNFTRKTSERTWSKILRFLLEPV